MIKNVHIQNQPNHWCWEEKRCVVLKIFSRPCRHFFPQCDSRGRSNQLTQSSATDSPGAALIWTFSPLWYVGSIKYYYYINILVLIRINDLSKEAILQCINEGDLRFLTVTWSTKMIPFRNTLFLYSDWWQWL